MNRTFWGKIVPAALLALLGLLFAQFVWRSSTLPAAEEAEKINLALRRTGHHLLKEQGDSTSRIPPVQRQGAHTWLVRLESPFNYDRLPALLHSSFEQQGIRSNYNVAVLACGNGEIQLGYNAQDLRQEQGVACGGRQGSEGCYNLQVTFIAPESAASRFATGGMLALGLLLTGLGFTFWQRQAQRRRKDPASLEVVPTEASRLYFGQSSLDSANQKLFCGEIVHTLTYRETKLLHLLASQANQLLEREFILQKVWGDEGLIVGRSVDVFVSRLRKLLRDDPSLRITAVHGVGYRLEAN